MAIFWLILFIILLFIELVTINLVTLWFALGAIAAMIATIFTDSVIIQSFVFIIVSLICLIFTKSFVRKIKGDKMQPTNVDRIIGKTGEVTKKIGRNKYGEVKVFGNTWTATSKEVINVGQRVKVLEIEGVKLIVEKEED